jgi:hypothetical protein
MSIIEIWEKLQSHLASVRELDTLNMDQREELARDVGVSEPVLERLFTSARGQELERLMYALSLDDRKIQLTNRGAIMRDMSIVCSECALVDRCQRELQDGSASRNYNEYCPNALTLNALLVAEGQSQPCPRR